MCDEGLADDGAEPEVSDWESKSWTMSQWAVWINRVDRSKHVAPAGLGDAMKPPHIADSDCECQPSWDGDSWVHHEVWVDRTAVFTDRKERVN